VYDNDGWNKNTRFYLKGMITMDNLEKLEENCIKAIREFLDELCRRNPEVAKIKIDANEITAGLAPRMDDELSKISHWKDGIA